jgi:PAS domain S-box-containing protein
MLKIQQKYINVLGKSGEFIIGYMQNDSVYFLLDHIRYDFSSPKPIPPGSKVGIPIKYALKGNTGFIKGYDYSHKMVLAYCNYIPELKWGMVTKIDISEVNEPFYEAGFYAFISSIVLVMIATLAFRKISGRIIEGISESQNRYHNLFEFSAVPIWEEDFSQVNDYLEKLKTSGITDVKRYLEKNKEEISHIASLVQIVDVNQKSVAFLNVNNKEEAKIHSLFSSDEISREVLKEEIVALASGKDHFRWEMPFRTSHNEMKYIIFHLSVMPGQENRLSRVLVSITDITERKQAEERIWQSEQRLKHHIGNSPLAVVEWDSDFLVTQWSGEAERIFGWKAAETIGKRIDSLNIIFKEDMPVVAQTMERLTSGKEHTVTSSNRNCTKTGNIIECTWYNSVLMDDKGKMESVMSLIQDITERKRAEKELLESKEKLAESEEKYRLLFNKMIDGFALHEIITNAQGRPVDYRFISINPAFEELTGVKADEIMGKTVLEVFPDTETDLIKIYANVALTGESSEFESFYAGLNKYFKVSVFSPKPGFFAVILEDITQRVIVEAAKKEADDQLKQYASNLKDLNATKDKFFGIIAHDLKNPFASLMGASEVLLNYIDQFDINNIKHISMLLNDSAKKGFALLENLLEWSRAQTGGLQFNPQKENIAELVNTILSQIEVSVLNKRINLSSNVSYDLTAEVDKNMFNTILRNLLHNAIKFTHTGGKVSVLAQKDTTYFTLIIKDSGIGINQKDIDKLFRLDTQHSTIGTAQEKGTGLGLLLCKEFVEKHGGKIWAESTLGKGSEFKFFIPYVSSVKNKNSQPLSSKLSE